MIVENVFDAVALVIKERDAQEVQWGTQRHPDLRWLAILMEEVGEVSKEIIEDEPNQLRRLRIELVQVAAVAVAWVEHLSSRIADGQENGKNNA